MKLKRSTIRKLIIQEINKIKEDALQPGFNDPDRQSLYKLNRSTQNKRSCSECGYSMYESESVCEQCGNMYEGVDLNEGDCGCGTSKFNDKKEFGNNALSMSLGSPDHPEIKKHGHNNYMAKPALYKVAKYSQKLLEIIPDGYELDDWQRTKIAQISDDISEVYHSLDYDKFEGDL